jgi:outer membrane protein assembly factor BamB
MARTSLPVASSCFLCLTLLLPIAHSAAQSRAWPTHSHDAQHTGISSVASQPLNNIHWKQRVDFAVPAGEIFIHYGSPLVTAANTVIVPVKAGADSFRVVAHNGTTGKVLWRQPTGYQAPSAAFLPGMGPTMFGKRLFIPDNAGRVLVRQTPDLANGAISELYFYGQKNFQANPTVYKQSVQISTPLTVDSRGDLFFGFLALGPTPIGLQSGLARIAADGTGTWASASFLAEDPFITETAMSSAPALSHDGSILYVAVSSGDFGFGYLLALNSKTLAVINKVRLTDPASGFDASMSDESSASPTVGPDGDVYYGVLENPFPFHNDRGWLLHFNGDLSVEKIPGSFGWDDTASIVDASLVASYHGTSSYLLMTKYNSYAGINTGDGHNRVAILDPNATENDPIIPNTQVMQEVITQLGVTPDPNFPSFPGAVREWCINTAVVDPRTKSVIVNSEDGKLYRWDLTGNTLSQVIKLSGGIGEAYTPTIIGADGTVYAINDAVLDAIGK